MLMADKQNSASPLFRFENRCKGRFAFRVEIVGGLVKNDEIALGGKGCPGTQQLELPPAEPVDSLIEPRSHTLWNRLAIGSYEMQELFCGQRHLGQAGWMLFLMGDSQSVGPKQPATKYPRTVADGVE